MNFNEALKVLSIEDYAELLLKSGREQQPL
jgi:hypothetical protein